MLKQKSLSFFAILMMLLTLTACSSTTATTATPLALSTAEPSVVVASPTNPPSTEVLVFTVTPLPDEIVDGKDVSMRLVSAGEFMMGSDKGDADEAPIHKVALDAFYMDKYEVTNALYKACVDAGVCKLPQDTKSFSRAGYYGNPDFNNYPVIYVDWDMAKTYCETWRGARLPTEAEWEKAARGADSRVYPWGEDINCNFVNFNNCKGDTVAVGSYEAGVSPYGIYDLAGNVQEWVSDWYGKTYYAVSPSSNPLGPDSGVYRVTRGGSFDYDAHYTRSTLRGGFTVETANSIIGFRCVATP